MLTTWRLKPVISPLSPLTLQKAAAGAEATRDLTARAGRASYIAAERVTLPDPGAVAVAAMLRAVVETLAEQKWGKTHNVSRDLSQTLMI